MPQAGISLTTTWRILDDFALAILYGMIGAVAGWIFMSIFRVCDRLFSLIPGPIYVQTTLAGLGLGSIAALLPLTRYFSHNELETVL